MTAPDELIGYWFAAEPRLPNGDGRAVVIGETLTVPPPIKCCERGLHASEHPFDALQYAPGPLLYRVRLSGEIDRQDDKACATERTALALIDATDLLRRFARQQALSVIHLWNAPAIVREYLETGDETKRDAAWDAAWVTVCAAARAAARDAAKDAAWAAAWDAAKAAAKAAAKDAVRAAAGDAAKAAAWAAAGDAFKRLVEEALP